ncbi:hypothetical protein PR1_144 [Providencia phage vB_PreS_PR1]|uniref:Tail terminator protein n=2 Tax=Priunavirus TaxID=2560210 RepID=A0A873WHS8_9CAUD|nr:tail terminator [Providencia phage vB_PreS_PR1]YP_010113920.1 tail terminator [Providencia phage PSTCR5]AQT25264.1 hypothetical protein PR1_144 [Providencia phage vB_PreS_PR1]QPB12133.1 hypothetical protein [Providencia phage PSTCR5]
MSNRLAIRKAYEQRIRECLDGTHPTEYFNTVPGALVGKFKTFEEIKQFPYIALNLGTETQDYQPSAQRWKYQPMTVMIFVKDNDDARREEALETLIYDLEKILDSHKKLRYTINRPDGGGDSGTIIDCSITSTGTDEGLLNPFALAEISFTVRYLTDTRLL